MNICENCGVEHSGTGRFCSLKCRYGFSTKSKRKEINEKVSEKLNNRINNGEKIGFIQRNNSKTLITNKCVICGVEFEHKRKGIKTCSQECLKILRSAQAKENKQFLSGGYRKGSGRGKGSWYDSEIAGTVYLDSTWEVAYAKYLDENLIQWKRNTKRFKYINHGKEHNYIPDFYLIDRDLYIEIKGFEIELDKLKWAAVPNLLVLFKQDLLFLGIELK